MKNEKTIICHSFPAWDTPYVKSTIELMTRLAGDFRVVFIDYHYTLKDVLKNPHTPKAQVLGRRSRWRKIALEKGNIEIFNSLPILPINWIKNKTLFKWGVKLNSFILNWQIKRLVKKHDLDNALMVNAFNPIYGLSTLRSWKSRKSFYYCYDEVAGTSWSGKHGPSYEKEFMKVVDEVIVTSPKLLRVKGQYNSNTHLVPNGVNLDIFKGEQISDQNNSIGYIGAVDNRLDIELINKLAERFPQCQLDFYGPVKIDNSLFKASNIHLHGSIDQKLLPAKISEMQVCIIPFVKNELTESIYPLKANEYLAMGKPVVSTNFADLSDFKGKIDLTHNENEFIEAVHARLLEHDLFEIEERKHFAHQNSWQNRAELMGKYLVA